MHLLIVMFKGISLFFFFFPPNGGGFLLCVVCTTFMLEFFVGVEVVLAEVFVVVLEGLVFPEDGFSGVDFTEPMIP